jgi:septal ring factor EnvC (AmiA/AmiB activator)
VKRLILGLSLALGLAGFSTLQGQAPAQRDTGEDQAARARALAARADERIRELQAEAASLAAQERTLLVELRQLDVRRDLKAAELSKLDAALAATSADIATNQKETERLEAAVAKQKPEIRARLIALYKLGRAGYWRLLLNVDNLKAIGRTYRDISTLARTNQERLAEYRRTLAALADSRERLAARQREEADLRAKAVAARAALDQAVASRQARIKEIDDRRDLAAQLTGELQVAQQHLQEAVDRVARGEPANVALPLKPFRGALEWPVDGRVVLPFGRPVRPGVPASLRRTGIEIAAEEGAPVHAVHGGTVAFADAFSGYGDLVILDHGDNAYSLYGYLGSLSVSRGERVEAGTVLGTVGRPPTGDSPRLYLEIRVDAAPVDPVQWLKAR